MSEKRFESTIDEETMSIMPYLVSDKEEECFYNLEGCVDLLNEQQATIEAKDSLLSILSKENEQLRKEHQEMLEKYLLLKLKIGELLNDE